jgi:hypothetical protein
MYSLVRMISFVAAVPSYRDKRAGLSCGFISEKAQGYC